MPWPGGSGSSAGGSRRCLAARRHAHRRSRRFRPSPCIFSCHMPAGGARRYPGAHAGRRGLAAMGPVASSSKTGPGAGGVIASQALVTSPPDGYTLIVVASGHATNPFLYPKLPYDTFKDFTPISLLASSPNILLVRADSPFKTLADMIAAGQGEAGQPVVWPCRQRHIDASGRRTFEEASPGSTSPAIPYKGGAPAINDLLGGQIPMSFNNGPESVGQIDGRHGARAGGHHRRRGRRSCPTCPAWPRPCRATTPKCGGACSGRPACRRMCVAKLSHDFVAALEHRCRQGAAGQARRVADRQFAAGNSTPRFTPTTTNGGRSSRPPASRPNDVRSPHPRDRPEL